MKQKEKRKTGHTNFFNRPRYFYENGIFGIYAIIDQIKLRITLKSRVRKIKRKLDYFRKPWPSSTKKIKILIFGVHRTPNGHLKGWSKMDRFYQSGIATQN
jgi:hypothetical protein